MTETGKKLKYQIVKELLEKGIQNGELGENECLPSERELCETYGVSRVTIRKAVEALEDDGLIYRFQGKGTFVKHPQKIEQVLSRLTGFSEDMQARNMRPESKILLLDRTAASKVVAEQLHLQPGDEVIILRRLRLADDEPMAIETTYLDSSLFHPVLTEFSGGSFYSFMRDVLHITPKRALQTLEVADLLGWEAELLGNEQLCVAMLMHRQTFDENDRPIEYVISKYRSDKYKFNIELFNL